MSIAPKGPGFLNVFDDFRNRAYSAWRYRWRGIGSIWVLCVCGWLLVLGLPDIYEGSSRVFVDTSSRLGKVLASDVVRSDTVVEADIMLKSMVSRPSLEKIASRGGLLIGGESPSEVEAVVGLMQKDLKLLIDRSQVLHITYLNVNPGVALSIVSILTDSFVEGLLALNRSDSDVARTFLEEQLANYEELLRQAETRLADFKRANIGQMPSERGDYYSRFQKEQEVLNTLDFELRLTRERQTELKRQIGGEVPVFGMVVSTENRSGVDSAVDRQVQVYEQELAVLRMKFTDSHPDIVRINSILEDLRAQQEKEQFGRPASKRGTLDENPVYQSMKIQLSAVELDLIELQAKRANQVRIVADLRSKIDIIPDIEANLTRLNRDYTVNKAQYDALLRRLETARMTEAAEESKTQFEFRMIDPPAVSPSPIGPNRVLFMTIVLILSIGAGAALSIFSSLMRPVFFSIRELKRNFDIPVLGGIKLMGSKADVAAERLNFIAFTGCFVALVCVYGIAVSMNQIGATYLSSYLPTFGLF